MAPASELVDHYNLLAKGYLSGHLSLSVLPSPELLALPDPYDPIANARLKIWDAALFNGRYYLYFGPTPALLVFAPFRLATSLDFPQSLAVAFFCSVGLFFAFLLLRFLAVQLLPRPPSIWLLLAGIWALGFCSVAPIILRRPALFEVAISCGYALVFASLYFFATGGLVARPRVGRLALASGLLGLAGGARFPLLAAGIVPLALAFFFLWKQREPGRRRLALLMALFAPVAACVFLLGWYNHARFGSWTEFGLSYTLHGLGNPRFYQLFSLRRLLYGVFYYTVVPVNWSATFPFARLSPYQYLTPPSFLYVEPVAGLLAHSPLLAILAALPWIRPRDTRFRTVLLMSLLLGSGLLLVASVYATTTRYEVDFATFFLLPALLLWFRIVQEAGSRSAGRARVLGGVFLGVLIVSVFSNLLISFGYLDNFKTAKPHIYEAVRDLFRPIESFLRPHLEIVQVAAPNGLEQLNGQSFFWLGGPPASVFVSSTRRQDVELGITFVPGPSADPGLPTRRVRVLVPELGWTRELGSAKEGLERTIRLPVDDWANPHTSSISRRTGCSNPCRSHNRIGDTRPLILGVQGLRVDPRA